MKTISLALCSSLCVTLILLSLAACNTSKAAFAWEIVQAIGTPTARHEAGLVAIENNIFLIGGRRVNPTDVCNTETQRWTRKSAPPFELHHFQPVAWQGKIYILGAMTGQWPNEVPVKHVIIYDPLSDQFTIGDPIPTHRQRGAAGAVAYRDKIYLIGGITRGHMGGYQAWFDEYDPKHGQWRELDNAPNARDHFQAATAAHYLFAFAGRTTSKETDQDMSLTVKYGNVYDFDTEQWLAVSEQEALPTLRAGNSAIALGSNVIIAGGESVSQVPAHTEVDVYDIATKTWRAWPSNLEGRHGTGLVRVDEYLYTISGSGNRGGGPELTTIERLNLSGMPFCSASCK
ncbi:kelch repeat-containing protein [Simiduia curdlanivorans]|uniref:Kelch repeat-containing protein n=1 Tax=Simiduia curdlanivorans TaxID=1492769 RepID=A0ABV8V1D8_9GAMM|nr:kelch repeat-containing protein [Simiduia curdlanivorans]MDN3639936.1 kelch repeat-containing protein [Simiduia curdlanivorans]